MAYYLLDSAHNCLGCAQRVYENVSSEVYGGEWTDDIGESYLAYADNIQRYAQSLVDICTQFNIIARNLDDYDVERDQNYVSQLAAEVR